MPHLQTARSKGVTHGLALVPLLNANVGKYVANAIIAAALRSFYSDLRIPLRSLSAMTLFRSPKLFPFASTNKMCRRRPAKPRCWKTGPLCTPLGTGRNNIRARQYPSKRTVVLLVMKSCPFNSPITLRSLCLCRKCVHFASTNEAVRECALSAHRQAPVCWRGDLARREAWQRCKALARYDSPRR